MSFTFSVFGYNFICLTAEYINYHFAFFAVVCCYVQIENTHDRFFSLWLCYLNLG